MVLFNSGEFETKSLLPRANFCPTASFDALPILDDEKDVDEASEVYVKLSLFSRLVVECGLITRKQFVRAGRLSSATGLPLGRALVIQKAILESRLATILDVCQRVSENTLEREEALESLNFVFHHFLSTNNSDDGYQLPRRNGKNLEELLVKSRLLLMTDLLTAIEIGLVRQERLEDTLVALGYVIEPAIRIATNLQEKMHKNEITFDQAVRCLSQIDWQGEEPTAEGLLEVSIAKGPEHEIRLTGGNAKSVSPEDGDNPNQYSDEGSMTTTSATVLSCGPDVYERLMESCARTAMAFVQRGDLREAENVYRRMLRMTPATPGSEQQIRAISALADLLCRRGADAAAADLVKQIICLLEGVQNYDGLNLAFYLSKLASIYKNVGLYEESEPPLGRALLIRESLLPDGHADVVANLREYGDLLLILNRNCEAEKLFVQSNHLAA